MEIHELTAFLSVNQMGSFSKAAAAQGVTQPAMSRRIQSLEQILEVKLFDRVGHDIYLTPAGHTLKPFAEAILESIQEAKHQLHNLNDEPRGVLKIVMSHHMAVHHMPVHLKNFSERFQKVQLDFEFMSSESGFDAITQGKGEIGLFTLPQNPEQFPRLAFETFQEDPLIIVVGKNHPLAHSKQPNSMQDLMKFKAILPPLNSMTVQPLLSVLNNNSITLHQVMACSSLESIKMLISIDTGWGLLPRSMLDKNLIEYAIPELAHLSRKLGMAFHKHKSLSQAGLAFQKLLQESTP